MTPRVALLSATVVLCSVVAASPLFGQPPVQPLALVNEARAASLQGQQDEAIALYREALMRAPGLYEAYYGLGIAFDLAERFAEARDAFIRAIQVAPDGSTELVKFGWILLRELPGIIVVVSYLALLPPFLALTVFRGFYKHMGLIRFMVMSNLLLMMMLLPIKMVLRWTINLKYLISIPEYLLNL